MKITINGKAADAIRWHRMPEAGQDKPVPVRVNGKRSEAVVTRGGVPPVTYSYFRIGDVGYYIKGHMPHDADINAPHLEET